MGRVLHSEADATFAKDDQLLTSRKAMSEPSRFEVLAGTVRFALGRHHHLTTEMADRRAAAAGVPHVGKQRAAPPRRARRPPAARPCSMRRMGLANTHASILPHPNSIWWRLQNHRLCDGVNWNSPTRPSESGQRRRIPHYKLYEFGNFNMVRPRFLSCLRKISRCRRSAPRSPHRPAPGTGRTRNVLALRAAA
jgi:hypothetical protein